MTTLATLLRLDDGQLEHFRVLTGAATQLSAAQLAQCRQLARCVERWLDDGADEALLQLLHVTSTLPAYQRSGFAQVIEQAQGSAGDAAGALGQTSEDASGGSTTHLDQAQLAAILAHGAIPFQLGPAALPPAQQQLAAHPAQGETGFADPAAIAAAIQQAKGTPPLPMSVHDYVSLVAHTEQGGPHSAAAARQRRHREHNIDDEAHRTAVDATFGEHFRHNRAAADAYSAALAQWRQWLRRGQ